MYNLPSELPRRYLQKDPLQNHSFTHESPLMSPKRPFFHFFGNEHSAGKALDAFGQFRGRGIPKKQGDLA